MTAKACLMLLLLWSIPLCAPAQSADSTDVAGNHDSTALHTATLEETVVTGVPMPVKLQNALAQYRIITKAAMLAQGAVTVADALTTQLNINLGNDRVLGSNITMQGLGGDKVKLLIDGLPVNGRENGNIDLGQISLNNVARIEIVQGPMSVLYGSDALGGVINIITAKATKQAVSAGFNYEDAGRYNADVAGSASAIAYKAAWVEISQKALVTWIRLTRSAHSFSSLKSNGWPISPIAILRHPALGSPQPPTLCRNRLQPAAPWLAGHTPLLHQMNITVQLARTIASWRAGTGEREPGGWITATRITAASASRASRI